MNGPVKLVEQRCPSCNAPMQVGPNDSVVTCRYCNNSITIQRQKPPRAAAPQVTSFGAGGPIHVPSTVLYIAPAATIGASIAPVLIPVFVLLIVGAGAGFKALGRSFVSLPTTCGLNESLTISGKTFDGKGPVVVASTNCKLTIKDSKLSSNDPIVQGGSNLELRIVNSTLTSKGNALQLGTNSKVWISEKSQVNGEEAAIKTEWNAEIDVKGSTLKGGRVGLELVGNPKVNIADSDVSGKEHGIKGGSNAKLTLRGGTLKSDEVALELDTSAEVDVQGTKISGKDGAVVVGSSADLKLTKKAELSAEKGDGIRGKSSSFKLLVDDSQITAGTSAVQIDSSSEIRVRKGGLLRGTTTGILAGSSMKLTVDGGTIESANTAVQGKSSAEVRMTDGVVKGKTAFAFDSRPSRFDVSGGTVSGEQRFDNRTSPSGASGSPADASSEPSNAQIIGSSRGMVRSCVDGKKVRGTLTVKLNLLPTGRVSSVTTVISTVPQDVESCVAGKLRGLVFPPRAGTSTVQTSYTFN